MNRLFCLRVLDASAFELLGHRSVLAHCWEALKKAAGRCRAETVAVTTGEFHDRVLRVVKIPDEVGAAEGGAETALRRMMGELEMPDPSAGLLVEARYPFLTAEKLTAVFDCIVQKKAMRASLGRPARFCVDTAPKFVTALGGLPGIHAQGWGTGNVRGATVLPIGPLEAIDVTEADGMKLARALVE